MVEQALFSGQDLEGWRHVGDGRFTVVDGCLRTEGGMGLLWYEPAAFGNCRLRVTYRTRRAEDNSGVFVRIDGPPADAWHAVHHGYEVQILAAGDEWGRSGVIYTMSRTEHHAERPPGEWNVLEVTLDGDRVRVHLNGVETADFEPATAPPKLRESDPARGPRPQTGYIGLQNHDADSVIDFREVVLLPLED